MRKTATIFLPLPLLLSFPLMLSLPLLLSFYPSHISAGHEKDGHNFFAVADEDEFGGFLVVSPEGMSDVGEREY